MKALLPTNRWLAILAAAVTTACATLAAKVGPTLVDRITFPHSTHQSSGVKCEKCHKGIGESTSLATSLLPKMSKCGGCHDVEDETGCNQCHTEPKAAAPFPVKERHLNFPHGKHLANPDIHGECQRCHPVLPEPKGEPVVPPAMDVCTGCHNHDEDYAQGRCALCHQELTRYPIRPVADFSHRGNFLKEHPLAARPSSATCAECHEQAFCADCHGKTGAVRVDEKLPERVDRAFIHRADFVGRHTVEARVDSASCLRCHGASFCQACHQNHGLTPGQDRTLNPHPPGFGWTGSGAHAREARRDIVRCAACHDQGAASICVECHRQGGVGGSPHPASWLGRHSRDEIAKNPMCQTCHL